MDPDIILAYLRELSAQAMPDESQPPSGDCDSLVCEHRSLAEEMAAGFQDLDTWLSRSTFRPADWAAPLIPAQRSAR